MQGAKQIKLNSKNALRQLQTNRTQKKRQKQENRRNHPKWVESVNHQTEQPITHLSHQLHYTAGDEPTTGPNGSGHVAKNTADAQWPTVGLVSQGPKVALIKLEFSNKDDYEDNGWQVCSY